MQQTLIDIARRELSIPTLERRGKDLLDFHEVYVANVADALAAAYNAGQASIKSAPVASALAALQDMLQDATVSTYTAVDAITQNKQNEAIGSILHLEETLPAATAILHAILVLHRHGRKGGAQ
jgi:hypothetical protein